MNEEQIVVILQENLEESGHLIFTELVISDTLLNIQQISDTAKRKRIDLAALSKYDGQILFFEAERELTIKHPTTFRQFADFTYLVAPWEAYQSLPKEVKDEQLAWAKESGIGIVLIEPNKKIHIVESSKKMTLRKEIRQAIRSAMQSRNPLSGIYPELPHFART